MAQIGNGKGLNAALGAAASQLAAGEVRDVAQEMARGVTDDPAKAQLIANVISNVISGGIGAAAGGETGAGAASNMDRNNRQLHPSEVDWIKENAKAYAEQQGISLEEATRELTQQALRTVDVWWAGVLPEGDNKEAQAFLEKAAGLSFDDPYVSEVPFFQAPGELYDNSAHLADNLMNDDYFEFIKQYGTSGITGDINAVSPTIKDDLIDFEGLWNTSTGAAALEGLNPEERSKLQNLLEMYATAVEAGMNNYALLGDIYNQFPIGDGPPRELNEDAYALADRINEIYGSDSAASIIYNDFSADMNSHLANYFIEAATLALTAKNIEAARERASEAIEAKANQDAFNSPSSSTEQNLWTLGQGKSAQKWNNQMNRRGWTEEQITEAVTSGKQYGATNNINPGNTATRYVHPTTGRSVVVDDVTHEVLHVGGDHFQY